MFRVATDPDGFFREVEPGPGAALVVVLVALPLAGVELLSALAVGGAVVGAVVRGLVLVPLAGVLWVVLAATFAATARLLGGEPGFVRTLAYVGYGFVPAMVSSWLKFAAAVPVALTGGSVATDPLVRALDSTAPKLAFLLWSGFLWAFAVREARNLSFGEAAVAVGVPVGVLALGLVV